MLYAGEFFRRQQPVGSSSAPLSAHLKQAAKQLGKDPEEFLKAHQVQDAPPEPPYALLWQWQVFLELDRRRQSSGYGPQPISFQEIASWEHLMVVNLRPWEVRLFADLDDVYLKAWSDGRPKQT